MNSKHLINVIGLAIGFASFYFEVLIPFWGIVFLYGAYQGIKTRKIALFFETPKQQFPVTFWLLVLLWVAFGIYFLLYAFY